MAIRFSIADRGKRVGWREGEHIRTETHCRKMAAVMLLEFGLCCRDWLIAVRRVGATILEGASL